MGGTPRRASLSTAPPTPSTLSRRPPPTPDTSTKVTPASGLRRPSAPTLGCTGATANAPSRARRVSMGGASVSGASSASSAIPLRSRPSSVTPISDSGATPSRPLSRGSRRMSLSSVTEMPSVPSTPCRPRTDSDASALPRYMQSTASSTKVARSAVSTSSSSSSSVSSRIPVPIRVLSRDSSFLRPSTSIASLNDLSFSSGRMQPVMKRRAPFETPAGRGEDESVIRLKKRRFEEEGEAEAAFSQLSDDEKLARFDAKCEALMREYEEKIEPIVKRREEEEARTETPPPSTGNGLSAAAAAASADEEPSLVPVRMKMIDILASRMETVRRTVMTIRRREEESHK